MNRTIRALRAVRWAAWTAVVLVGVFLLSLVVFERDAPVTGSFTTASFGGPFELIDQTGKTVTDAALKGRPSALFFGFTYCPSICPTTLAELSARLAELAQDGDKLRVYFVTVDPERDTREALAAYLEAFDPRIVALTGPPPAVQEMLKAYRVFSRKVPDDSGGYTMDHTTSVYLLDRSADLVGTIDFHDDPAVALAKLKRLLNS